MKNVLIDKKPRYLLNIIATLIVIAVSVLTIWDWFYTDPIIKILLTNSSIYARAWQIIRVATMIVTGIIWLIFTLVMINKLFKSNNFIQLFKIAFLSGFIGFIIWTVYSFIEHIAFGEVPVYELQLEFVAALVLLIGYIVFKRKAKDLYEKNKFASPANSDVK